MKKKTAGKPRHNPKTIKLKTGISIDPDLRKKLLKEFNSLSKAIDFTARYYLNRK